LNALNDPVKRDCWARLRFSIIGPLMAAPPAPGELNSALQLLAAKTWRHPTSGLDIAFGLSTVERWYYAARRASDPVAALKNRLRGDVSRFPSLSPDVIGTLYHSRVWDGVVKIRCTLDELSKLKLSLEANITTDAKLHENFESILNAIAELSSGTGCVLNWRELLVRVESPSSSVYRTLSSQVVTVFRIDQHIDHGVKQGLVNR